ncbi:ABC transporter ATP-binding protein [Dactylosporangium sp. NPDC051484]|uniref:ABC transporter ATP-binding protein n=1 Tax=Dactylosporangium sp. NPDC051484 TaxID=3154942 RepID=UPI00344B8F8A
MTGSRILWRAVTRNRKRLVAGSGLICLHQLAEAAVPILIGVGIDRAVAPGDGRALLVWVAALGGLFVAVTTCYRFGARQLMLAIANEGYLMRGEVAAKIMHPRGIRTELRAGELLTVSSTDADNVSYLLDYIPRIAGAVTATIACAGVLLSIDVPLGVLVLAGTPLVLLGMQAAAPRITRRVTRQQELAGRASALATDLVTGIRPLRGLGAERAADQRYRDISRQSLGAALAAARAQGWNLAASTAGSALLASGVAVLAGWFALDGRISVGEFIAVIGLAQFLLEPLGLLAIVPSWVAEARASADRTALVLAADVRLPEGTAPVGLVEGAAPRLDVVRLRHGSLDGLDLTVRPGELVGVVAARSADAEALMRVLSGGASPDEYDGTVSLGGTVLHELDLDRARAALLVEPHRTDLFTGTVATNVAATTGSGAAAGTTARPDGFDEALAASAANEVVADHPDGAERAVAERGMSLSGGQRQRLALARALLARPPVLVLHDPTTAVDAVTEHAIARAVRALRHGEDSGERYATLVVTSSPALLAVADRVVVLDAGRARAEGRHAELGTADEDYRRMVLR